MYNTIEEAQAAADKAEKENTDLKQQLDEAKKELSQKDADIEDLNQVIADIRQNTTASAAAETFTLGKNNYQILVSAFRFEKVDYTAKELAANKELQKKLIDKKAGFIKLVE